MEEEERGYGRGERVKKAKKWAFRGGKRLQRLPRKETMTRPEKGERRKREYGRI